MSNYHLAIPGMDVVGRTLAALRARGFHSECVPTRADALLRLVDLIPPGAAIAGGSTRTLEKIGFITALKHHARGHRYLNSEWMEENDSTRRTARRAVLSASAQYLVLGAQAITEQGEIVASGGADDAAAYLLDQSQIIWIAGIDRIVPALDDARQLLRAAIWAREEQRASQPEEESVASRPVEQRLHYRFDVYEGAQPDHTHLILVAEGLGL